MIAHKTWRLKQGLDSDKTARSELRRAVDSLNPIASSFLWGGLARHPAFVGHDFFGYLRREPVDWTLVGEAAAIACSLLKGGDVANPRASLALERLVDLYEKVLPKTTTFSLHGVGPTSLRGTRRMIGDSEGFLFVTAFFNEVDAEGKELWLTGKLRTLLRLRKSLRRGGNMDNLSQP